MNMKVYNGIANFIRRIADDALRDVYVRGQYRKPCRVAASLMGTTGRPFSPVTPAGGNPTSAGGSLKTTGWRRLWPYAMCNSDTPNARIEHVKTCSGS